MSRGLFIASRAEGRPAESWSLQLASAKPKGQTRTFAPPTTFSVLTLCLFRRAVPLSRPETILQRRHAVRSLHRLISRQKWKHCFPIPSTIWRQPHRRKFAKGFVKLKVCSHRYACQERVQKQRDGSRCSPSEPLHRHYQPNNCATSKTIQRSESSSSCSKASNGTLP
jgi:hypothetical protein